MKAISLIATLILVNEFSLYSHDIKFGMQGGVNVASIHLTNDAYHYFPSYYFIERPLLSFNINGYAGYKGTGKWGASIEPGIIRKGFYLRTENQKGLFYYMQIPVLSDFYISKKITLSIGPEIAYLLAAREKRTYWDESENMADYFDTRFELSGIIGFNFITCGNWNAGIRYNHGLTHFRKVEKMVRIGTPPHTSYISDGYISYYNQYIQLYLRFKTKGKSNGVKPE